MPFDTSLVRTCVLALSLAALGAARASADTPMSQEPSPAGVGVSMTLEGPVFTDGKGMSLYYGRGRQCTNDHQVSVVARSGGDPLWKEPLTLSLPLSCVQKTPPFLAPAGARPAGDWSLVERTDGTRQWAYKGKPLHTSIKDRAPGDLNGSYRVRIGSSEGGGSIAALAPIPGAPEGVTVRQTVAGLVFADHTGKTLYVPDAADPSSTCRGACLETWRPLAAPALSTTAGLAGDWSIVTGDGGFRQWAFKGRPVYTYDYDAEANSGQLLGDTYGAIFGPAIAGWKIAVAKAPPRPPAGVTVQKLAGDWEQFNSPLPSLVYADRRGRPLYTMHCRHGGRESVTCDDVGDDPRYWASYCGGPKACAATWTPLIAPPNARRDDGLWSVVTINPQNPFQAPAPGHRQRVWAYRGRPVFTYAGDRLPGDVYGDDQAFAVSGDGVQARPIFAYARETEARPPVVAVAGR
jgi:predicted lipoprotein with Yx(FWY)xxD motif